MEILVGDDRLDSLKACVSGRLWVREHARGVENIEALILHRPHVETIHRYDHEDVEVVLAAIGFFIPPHRGLKAFHCKIDFVDVVCLGENLKRDLAPARCRKGVLNELEIAGYQRVQIGRF